MKKEKLKSALDMYSPLKVEAASNDLPKLMEEARAKENICKEECKLLYQTSLSQYIIQKYQRKGEVDEGFGEFLAKEYDIHVDEFPKNLKEILIDEVFPLLKRFLDQDIKKEEVDVDTLADIALEKMEEIDEGISVMKRKYDASQRL